MTTDIRIKRKSSDDPVANYMQAKQVSGNSRDYVLMYDNGDILDHAGRIYYAKTDNGETIKPDTGGDSTVRLVHKSQLWRYIGAGSRHFWRNGQAVPR